MNFHAPMHYQQRRRALMYQHICRSAAASERVVVLLRQPTACLCDGFIPKLSGGLLTTAKRNYRLLNSSPQSSHQIELRCQMSGGPDCCVSGSTELQIAHLRPDIGAGGQQSAVRTKLQTNGHPPSTNSGCPRVAAYGHQEHYRCQGSIKLPFNWRGVIHIAGADRGEF